MKYALIGCGRIATNHIKAAVNNRLEIAAVCDIVPEKMEELLAKHGLENDTGIARFTDYKEVLSHYSPSSYEQYGLDGHIYAVPEQQTFNVMFYRKDVMEELELEVPQTWKELIPVISPSAIIHRSRRRS